MRLRREIKAYIEAELRDYHQTKADLVEAKDDFIHQAPIVDLSGVRGTDTSRPTESKVLKMITNKRIKRAEQIIRAIETVVNGLPDEKFRLIELRYWKRPRTLTDEGIAQEIGCDRRTLCRWMDGILLAIGIEMGLVDEVSCQKDVTIGGT